MCSLACRLPQCSRSHTSHAAVMVASPFENIRTSQVAVLSLPDPVSQGGLQKRNIFQRNKHRQHLTLNVGSIPSPYSPRYHHNHTSPSPPLASKHSESKQRAMDITDTDVGPGIAEAPEKANTQVDTTDRPGPSAPPPPPPVSQLLTLSEKQRLCFWAAAQPLVNGARPSYIRIRRYFSAKYNGRLLEQGTINAALRASYTLIGFDLMAKPPKEPRRSQWPLLDSALFTWHYQCSNYESHKALKEQAMLLFPTLYPGMYIQFLRPNVC